MSFETITGIAARTQLRVFGENVTLSFLDGTELKTKAIIAPHMTHLKEQYSDFESSALIASIAKKDVLTPDNLVGIATENKFYKPEKYKLEPDGFTIFFLSE